MMSCKLLLTSLGLLLCSQLVTAGLTDIISNYARVRTSNPPPRNNTVPGNDSEVVEYDDFDDFNEAAENKTQESSVSAQTMLQYFNGVVSLLALMHKFGGARPGPARPQRLELRPRRNDNEARYHPSTATNKFLKKEAEKVAAAAVPSTDYQPLDDYPPYSSYTPATDNSNPGGKTSYAASQGGKSSYIADSYQGGKTSYMEDSYQGGKTSYDSDKEQYQGAKLQQPLTDYMAQNDPSYEIHKAYSYEVPHGYQDSYQPWAGAPPDQQSLNYGPEEPEIPKMKPMKKNKKPVYEEHIVEHEEDGGDHPWEHTPPKDHYPIYIHADAPHDFDYKEEDHHDEKEKDLVDEHREGKYPYSYYHLGRKLWYVPLLFSVYFIIYIAALILKAVGRHKIQIPEKLWDLHESHDPHPPHGDKHRRQRQLDTLTDDVLQGIDTATNKYRTGAM